jgi:hypothetical protein
MHNLLAPRSMAGLFGFAFLIVGVLGFIPGAVQDYMFMHWWRPGSNAQLFGLFQTSILDNLVYVGFGVAGLVMARSVSAARVYLTIGGVVYTVLAVYGLLVDRAGSANVLPADRADDWLHLGLGVTMIYAGLAAALPAYRPAASP